MNAAYCKWDKAHGVIWVSPVANNILKKISYANFVPVWIRILIPHVCNNNLPNIEQTLPQSVQKHWLEGEKEQTIDYDWDT